MAFVFSESTTTEIIHFLVAALIGPFTVFNSFNHSFTSFLKVTPTGRGKKHNF